MSSKDDAGAGAVREVRPFPYLDAASGGGGISAKTSAMFLPGQLSEAEIKRREDTAYQLGKQQGVAEMLASVNSELARGREALAEAIAGFASERKKFYEGVEPEIVSLALSIAGKVLHREAQIDPLLLAGMVRVALEKIEFSTQVTVRVHPAVIAAWREHFSQKVDPRDLPEFVEDPALDEQRCVLETHLGKTELGWEVQLKEIEQGLLDLLAQRPKASA